MSIDARRIAADAARAAIREAHRSARGLTLEGATVEEGGTEPTVIVDSDTAVADPDPIPARLLCDPPASGQRVVVTFDPAGVCYITGITGGAIRNLGVASWTDPQTDITDEANLDGLELGVTITQPGRLIIVTIAVHVEAQTGSAPMEPVLRARLSGDPDDGALVGGIVAETTLVADGDNHKLSGETLWRSPDPGEYTLVATLANGGSGTVDTITSDNRIASIRAVDAGADIADE